MTTYAGYGTKGNSPNNVGMSPNAWNNTYFANDIGGPLNPTWEFSNYDTNGSYAVPVVDAYNGTGAYQGPRAGFTGF
eukprot:CAMPEP_0173385198 /NCGR_PEP_ID=MMETSP1356-20130122/7809_1 /TAXON_ID=77927 ORGANISM="Hemiselmis virescens, Strain PCC157" /NCGR_SAMPLE_ID=MMETSP1356 /ASSEMBLY_ACC=CAM_ASM_000847 /LENGTH=76 /DNA_ID=CAMNT_0014340899 /DNA_START=127 /DNA_END=357 /DNA_ORIENTATION=+